jgi:hypothetical protein
MKRRNCIDVITKIIDFIPETEQDFITALKFNQEDAAYKAPEETIQWYRTADTLDTYIPFPKEDWHFEVLSIFMVKEINELREMAAKTLTPEKV